MTALLVQTAVLLLGAYFIGAFIGCLLRRTFFSPAVPVAVDMHPAVATVEAAAPAASPPLPRRLQDMDPIRPKIESIPDAPGEGVAAAATATSDADTLAAATDRFARSLTGHDEYVYPQTTPEQVAAAPSPEPETAAPPPAPMVKAPEPAPAPVAKKAEPVPAPVAKAPEPSAPVRPVMPSSGAAAAMAAAAAAGLVGRTKEIKPQPDLPAAAGTSGQASTSAPRGPVVVPPVIPEVKTEAPAAADGPLDDLTRIRAIDVTLQDGLRKAGVRGFADIAGWRTEDVRRISELFGFKGRIEQENWIEQAQILAAGGRTVFERSKSDLGRELPKPTKDEGRPIAPDAMAALSRSTAAASGIGAAVASSVAALPPRRPTVAFGRDNLQRISQINEEVERLLNVQGVSRYEQIAHWTGTEVTRFERLLGGEGRVSRENWIEQAQILARNGETAFSREFDRKASANAADRPRPTQLAEAIRTAGTPAQADAGAVAEGAEIAARKVDLTALRSVRSDAFRGDADGAAAPASGPTPPVRPDDLKRIRGVGVLIEKRLNAMGVWSYEQVANWTNADIDRISQALEFRGRIERENWVEQARILGSGGQTEFAKRVDRGEVETSRPKRGS